MNSTSSGKVSSEPRRNLRFRWYPRLRGWSGLAEEKAHHDGGRTANDPEKRALLKMQMQVRCSSDASADVLGINRTEECGDTKDQEVNAASGAALDVVRVDFFDDAVRNHRRARCHAKDEHRDVRRNGQEFERELESGQNNRRRAPDDHRFALPDSI